ncbi:hypothetical protein PTTG_10241 [Puccinia triticina 1-1 BBBD Race 1]|uniref:OTU domain-containing protein n=1 Tax=Puccinia triticina (isolate 1-1 / race 1 (BBBD)) TaxID=630390 RepID=A0A180FZ53_PUCT1|nr:hypothetical protein PTTG_10241 [Puccinia triticina 1-1 BBBD Race 1]
MTSTKQDLSAYEIFEAKIQSQKPKRAKKRAKATINPARKSKRLRKANKSKDEDKDNEELPEVQYLNSQKPKPQAEPKQDDFEAEQLEENLDNNKELDNEALLALLDESTVKQNYVSQVPKHLQKLFKDQFDPKCNGNCGFQCVLKALGYCNAVGFLRVREEMIIEGITERLIVCSPLGYNKDEFLKIIDVLKIEEADESNVPPGKWLSKLSHGQILVNAYTRQISFLSSACCHTYLPSRLGPRDVSCVDPIYLLHVNNNHWVLIRYGPCEPGYLFGCGYPPAFLPKV